MTPQDQLQFFAYQHLPNHLQKISKPFGELAQKLCEELPDNPEKVKMLDALMVAKDCAVRSSLWMETGIFLDALEVIKAEGPVKFEYNEYRGRKIPVLRKWDEDGNPLPNVLHNPLLLYIIPPDIDASHVIYSYDSLKDEVVIDFDGGSRRCPTADFIYGRLPK